MQVETAPEKSTTLTPEKAGSVQSFMAATKPYTLEVKHAEKSGVIDQARAILILGRKGRGPCPACEGVAEVPHHGGSKCKKRATLAEKIRLQPVINFTKNIFRKVNLFSSVFR